MLSPQPSTTGLLTTCDRLDVAAADQAAEAAAAAARAGAYVRVDEGRT